MVFARSLASRRVELAVALILALSWRAFSALAIGRPGTTSTPRAGFAGRQF